MIVGIPLLVAFSLSEACGVAVHSYLVERIIPFLPLRLAQHASFVRAGAFYPDAFYNCMGQYDAAEDAHWPPFLKTGIDLVKRRQATGNTETAPLEAFLVGVLTHQVSDVSWHSLGIFQGLLRAMADREFAGDYDEAHTALDVGGDMIQLHRLSRDPEHSQWLHSEWDYDVEDVGELLRMSGYSGISRSAITYCMARGKAALNAELNVASVGYKRFARRSPLLFDQLETYFAGGQTDMQQQIEECLPRFLAWLEGDELADPWDICQLFDGKRPDDEVVEDLYRRRGDPLISRKGIFEILKDISTSIKSSVHAEAAASLDCEIIPSPDFESANEPTFGSGLYRPGFGSSALWWNRNWVVASPNEGNVYLFDEVFNLTHTISAKRANKVAGKFASQFGAALAVWEDYLVVASPGLSTVDLFDSAGKWSGTISWSDATTEYGQRGLKLVGTALAVDQDLGTLFISVPYFDDLELELPDQVGAVYALPRSILRKAARRNVVKLSSNEYLMAKGTKAYERLGAQLTMTPRFVLVGSPGNEQVHGFDYATHKKILTLESPQVPDSDISGFGGYTIAGDKDYVIIGSPAASDGAQSQSGKIYMYKNAQMQSIAGKAEFEWLGSTGVYANIGGVPTVLLASPHAADGRGAFYRLNLKTQELSAMGSPPLPAGSGFGRCIASNGTMAVVGMPYYQTGGQRIGAVAAVSLSSP